MRPDPNADLRVALMLASSWMWLAQGSSLPAQEPEFPRILNAQADLVYCLAFSPDGKTLASGGEDKTIRLWDMTSGKNTAILRGYTSPLASVQFSPDGKTLASSEDNGLIRVWDVNTTKTTATLKGDANALLAFSPDGKTLAWCNDDGRITLWNLANQKTTTLGEHPHFVEFIAFSLDGKTLACAFSNKVWLWALSTGEVKHTFTHICVVCAMTFSPDSRTLAVGGDFPELNLWEVTTGKSRLAIRQDRFIHSLAFSPNGKILVVNEGGELKLWDMIRGIPIQTLKMGYSRVLACTFRSAGKTLIVAHDVRKGIELLSIPVQKGPTGE